MPCPICGKLIRKHTDRVARLHYRRYLASDWGRTALTYDDPEPSLAWKSQPSRQQPSAVK